MKAHGHPWRNCAARLKSLGAQGWRRACRQILTLLTRWMQRSKNCSKRRQNRNLSDEDKVRLEELIEQREAIQIKYDLVPEDGYEQILQGVQDEVNRAFARGEGDASVSVYAEGLTAAAQGYSAVNEEIDRQYDAERALIDLMEEGEAKQAEYAALDQKYKEDRAAAAREYASALEQMLDPVWESEGIQKANEGMEELFQLFRQYSTVGSEGYQNPEILEQMNALVGELNEDDLISYLGLLQQVQTLLDGGMSEGEVTGIFGRTSPADWINWRRWPISPKKYPGAFGAQRDPQ